MKPISGIRKGMMAALPLCMGLASSGIDAREHTKPNFIVIFIDDLGYNDLGYRNSSFVTPNIDRLAAESIDFLNAYVPSPTSSPSRAALLTGQYPVRFGITRHINANNPDPWGTGEFELLPTDPGRIPNRVYLPNTAMTFASYLGNAGYTTVAVGKWHLGTRDYYPDHHGFQKMYGESDCGSPVSYWPSYFEKGSKRQTREDGEYLTDYLTDCAVEAILEQDYSREPLCLYLAHYGVHSPHMAPSWMTRKYTDTGMDNRYAIYHAMVESVDHSVGRILDAVRQAGIEDNTFILFASDQGGFFSNAPLRGGKIGGALYEGGARVPFIVKYPKYAGGRKVQARISTLDVLPTMLELAGVRPASAELDGKSLCGVLEGGTYKESPLYFYRSYEDQPASLIYKDYKFIWSRTGKYELYNLDEDQYETTNLYGLPEYRTVSRRMKIMLEAFLEKYEPDPVS
ncbi:MAG: sulfatase-like hydrolase/transferase [Candidatus Cryptobacteroides sp.]